MMLNIFHFQCILSLLVLFVCHHHYRIRISQIYLNCCLAPQHQKYPVVLVNFLKQSFSNDCYVQASRLKHISNSESIILRVISLYEVTPFQKISVLCIRRSLIFVTALLICRIRNIRCHNCNFDFFFIFKIICNVLNYSNHLVFPN